MKIQISKDTVMTPLLLAKIMEISIADEARKEKLANYYIGEQQILNRQMSDSSKPNNRIVHSYGNYITDSIVGYFMGQPVNYAAKGPEYEPLMEELQRVFDYNDEQSENVELAKDASKYGAAYELVYLDENADIRFKYLDAVHCIPVYSNTLDEDLLYFIRYYNDNIFNPASRIVEVISAYSIATYQSDSDKQYFFVDEVPHSFGMVPVNIFLNNLENVGDYELVISLIDAYDKLNSDSVNDFEQFADAYLTLKGMDGTSSEDVSAMRENRILLLPTDGEAAWLVKNINDTYFQNTVTTLDADIHKFSKVPNMMDQAFGSNLSGIAIKYKLIALENKVAIKEAYFKKGLQRRIELINNILSLMGNAFEYLGIDIKFHRNLPVNELEAVQMANAINGLVSDETMLSLLPFINDPAAELEKRDSAFDPSMSVEPIVSLDQNNSMNNEETINGEEINPDRTQNN